MTDLKIEGSLKTKSLKSQGPMHSQFVTASNNRIAGSILAIKNQAVRESECHSVGLYFLSYFFFFSNLFLKK